MVSAKFSLLTGAGNDYRELNAEAFDVFLTFNDANRRQTFDVTIVDDNALEFVERFNLELRFDPFAATPSGVQLNPNASAVYIQDNDSKINTEIL